MNAEQNIRYREIIINPVIECASYTPKFGHARNGGFTLNEFQELYRADTFYHWLGLDNSLMYSAHKAAGGITSIYRQIGIGCERLVREIIKDYLELSASDVIWSYTVNGVNGKQRTLSLDARIIIERIPDKTIKNRCSAWMEKVAESLELAQPIREAVTGIVFEVRQGYKSKDSKRQNADIANASNAYANGYIPCLMVMSKQIDDDIVSRYNAAKWSILKGCLGTDAFESTFDFFREIIGFDFVRFMNKNQDYFQSKIQNIVEQLMRAE